MTLCDKLVFFRKKEGLSQMEVSERLGVSRQAVSRWEAGTSRPSTQNLQALSKMYHVTLDDLLDDRADPPDSAPENAAMERQSAQKDEKRMAPGKKSSRKLWPWIIGICTAAFILILAVIVCTRHEKRPIPFSDLPVAPAEESQSPTIEFTIDWDLSE